MLKVLLVDDDPEEFDLLQLGFSIVDQSVKLLFAECCKDLLEQIDKFSPDIIFMDINLPRFTGVEWLKLIRAIPAYRSLCIIMYSTTRDRSTIKESYHAQANFYVVKPSSIQGLEFVLRKVLETDWSQCSKPTFENFVIHYSAESHGVMLTTGDVAIGLNNGRVG